MLRIGDVSPRSWFLPIPDSGSRISDPGSKNSNKREGWQKIVVILFFVAINFTKLKIILFLEFWRKKIWANFQKLIELFLKKLSLRSQIYGFGIRKKPISDSGSRIQGSIRHRILEPDPHHCLMLTARWTRKYPRRRVAYLTKVNNLARYSVWWWEEGYSPPSHPFKQLT